MVLERIHVVSSEERVFDTRMLTICISGGFVSGPGLWAGGSSDLQGGGVDEICLSGIGSTALLLKVRDSLRCGRFALRVLPP